MENRSRPKYIPFEGIFTPITELNKGEDVIVFPRGRKHFLGSVQRIFISHQPDNQSILVSEPSTGKKLTLGGGTTVMKHTDYVDYFKSRHPTDEGFFTSKVEW